MSTSDAHAALASCRADLDRIDAELVRLLSERAALALQIGDAKKAAGLPIFAPDREADVIARARLNAEQATTGALEPEMAATVFTAIVSETRNLQIRRAA
ncbi:MAG: chorismate mutase [Bacteroidetes bacterium]|nr:chorismate mutase [Bacteroidota bacterium]